MVVLAAALLAGCGGAAAPAPTPSAAPAPGAAPTPDPNATTVGSTTATPGTDPSCTDPIACANNTSSTAGGVPSGSLPPLKDTEEVANFASNDNALFAAQADFTQTDTTSTDSTTTSTDAFNTETTPTPSTTTEKVTTVTQAKVSIDDSIFTVKKGSVLPKDTQQFEVTALSTGSITLTLTAGEFANGSDSFSVKVGQAYKLVNENEGTTYVLKLVSVS